MSAMIERQEAAREAVRRLSVEQVECLRLIVAGESQTTIASQLGLTTAQAFAARQSLMESLGANCTADAVREGIYAGLCTDGLLIRDARVRHALRKTPRAQGRAAQESGLPGTGWRGRTRTTPPPFFAQAAQCTGLDSGSGSGSCPT